MRCLIHSLIWTSRLDIAVYGFLFCVGNVFDGLKAKNEVQFSVSLVFFPLGKDKNVKGEKMCFFI